jgi:hypothetical protein
MFEPLEAPMKDYMTADLPVVADFRELDGTTYHELHLIVKRHPGGHAGVYCLGKDWPQTMAAQLAYYLVINRSLMEQVTGQAEAIDELVGDRDALLGDSLKHRTLTDSAVALSAENLALRRQADVAHAENDALRVAIAALQSELVRAIDGQKSDLDLISDSLAIASRPQPNEATPIVCRYAGCDDEFKTTSGRGSHEKRLHGAVWQSAPLPIVSIDSTWRCGVCYSDAFAQSVAHPDRCIRCAKMSMNGHALEAA